MLSERRKRRRLRRFRNLHKIRKDKAAHVSILVSINLIVLAAIVGIGTGIVYLLYEVMEQVGERKCFWRSSRKSSARLWSRSRSWSCLM